MVDHRAIEHMKKAKHKQTTKRLTVLLLKLQDFQLDFKYMQGPKMHVSDTLSSLYSEENHKITDIIPLNFLQHIDEDNIHKSYQYCTSALYHCNVVNTNTPTIKRCGRPPIFTTQKQDKNAKINITPPKQAITR